MLDFLLVSTRRPKKGIVEIYPRFVVGPSTDLMIRGGDFYAIWNDDTKLWSTDMGVALKLIDRELDEYAKKHKDDYSEELVKVLHMWDSDSGSVDRWMKFLKKQMWDMYHPLDEELIFANTQTTKKSYASKKLKYPFEPGPIDAYDELMSTLYSEEERHKLEWAIGAIVSGESKYIQKFIVMYGAAGTGKSTVMNIMQDLFDGYYSVFDSRALGSASNVFALEAFRSNPLVAIQHDGDLSRIEDNTRINSLVSHEEMIVNEKFKSGYSMRFNSFIIMGTNKPVRITDAKSGLIRRLIDVSPTGEKVKPSRYKELTSQIKFELGAIAAHCLDIYRDDPDAYNDYVPLNMLSASNDFYNFVYDSYEIFKKEDCTTVKIAYEMYKTYCDEAKVLYPYNRRAFQEELKNYFKEYYERKVMDDGTRVRNYYVGFLSDKFDQSIIDLDEPKKESSIPDWLIFNKTTSLLDVELRDCPAQLASSEGTPLKTWASAKTTLKDISTTSLHYVKPPLQHIVVDFDLKDKDGNKSYELNAAAASKWQPTYGELSKSGEGIHLHYIYDGDVSQLSAVVSKDIEVKVFSGNSSLRRMLSKCNDIPIRTINTGIPFKEVKEKTNVINIADLRNNDSITKIIKKCLNKEYPDLVSTRQNMDFIYKVLDDAYTNGATYDVTPLRQSILIFAANSTHQSDYCLKLMNKMHFKSEETHDNVEDYDDDELVFFDVEVFPNLFVVVYKPQGKPAVRMVNPTPMDIEILCRKRLIGFNCRRYDNHILYARLLGYSNEQLFQLSSKIIGKSENAFFGEAYNLSYTDIYDFASAGNKMSLKKLEIKMGIHHQELGLRWDQPAPEELWDKVAEYCVNDVVATEAAFDYLKSDWMARQMLATITDSTVNDTTNTLTARLIFGKNKNPQSEFVYTDLSKTFPGYKYDHGTSTYRGEVTGEGGYVYAEPGMYWDVALLDIASLHPHSAIAMNIFGDRYTKIFKELVDTRIAVKHKDREAIRHAFGGKLAKFADAEDSVLDALADALKTAINSVYGLTSAHFTNPFKDERNVDNIVAKRGALFMINLKHEVQDRGFTVAHIKTDSIKIPNATPEIIQFVMDYGKQYGYTFEHEATYEKMCLVNDAVYIAKYASLEHCEDLYGNEYLYSAPDVCKKNKKKPGKWDATGAQFQQPYVFKKLFSKEPIIFEDMCETKSVQTALYLDMNENLNEDEHDLYFVGRVGQFCPIMPGREGGELLREGTDKNGDVKYSSATGAKGYRWLESEMVKTLHKENDIDENYYRALVDAAKESIAQYGDIESFTE